MRTTFKTIAASLMGALLAVLLVACGSNQSDALETNLTSGIAPTTKSAKFGKPASEQAVAAAAKELASFFNGKNANNPQALTGAPAATGNEATAEPLIAPSNAPRAVYRFFNTSTGAHFFTMSVAERDHVRNNLPQFNFEGTSFFAYAATDPALKPVYRFFNKITGTHFFTINATERDNVIATLAHIYNFEGIAWYASQVNLVNWVPVYRFFNTLTGTHFYTTSAVERDNVRATLRQYNYEGIAYYVRPNATPDPDEACGITNFQTEMLAIVNARRAAGAVCTGVSFPAAVALNWNTQLQQAATRHAVDMGSNDFFSHTGSDGSRLGQRITDAGYIFQLAGENIGAGYTTATQAVDAWMSSTSGHCENIMNSSFRDIAVSCKTYPQSTYKNYWVMELGVR